MEDTNSTINLLVYVLMFAVIILFVIFAVFIILKIKDSQKRNQLEGNEVQGRTKKQGVGVNKQSIFNFMEFDTIEDNMIIQKDGNRFLMVVECQGINYDLMSGVEKASVEEGFVQFLNSLRHPIQIYVQTRTVDLGNSLKNYKDKVQKEREKLDRMKIQYNNMKEMGTSSKEQLERAYFEITKQTNLYEYGIDIIYNTEKMSQNKNVLNKKYYIIIPYYASEIGNDKLDKEEIKNLVFSELYTRAQSIIRSISSCEIRGKILNSNELLELLYMAYNRDEAEVFGMEKAIKAGYNELYSTAPDVLNKKMKALDEQIEERAIERARNVVDEIRSEKELQIFEKEENMDDLIEEMAKIILKENEQYIGKDLAQEAIDKIDGKTTEKNEIGGKENDVKKIIKRGRPKKTA